MAVLPLFSSAQNIQLHYDLGKQEDGFKRDFFVGTFEFFRPDTLGYTFFFTDFEFNAPGNPRGASLGYFELSREFIFPWLQNIHVLRNLGAHLEYNDGQTIYSVNDSTIAGLNLGNSWLAGAEYSFRFNNLSLNAMILYKYIHGSSSPDFQCTLVWYYALFSNKVNLSGYIDVWSQDDFSGNPENKILVYYSEPQIWFHVSEHFSLGSECKVSKNFITGSKRVEAFPTLGIKWEF
jgi:hypothetical protein